MNESKESLSLSFFFFIYFLFYFPVWQQTSLAHANERLCEVKNIFSSYTNTKPPHPPPAPGFTAGTIDTWTTVKDRFGINERSKGWRELNELRRIRPPQGLRRDVLTASSWIEEGRSHSTKTLRG